MGDGRHRDVEEVPDRRAVAAICWSAAPISWRPSTTNAASSWAAGSRSPTGSSPRSAPRPIRRRPPSRVLDATGCLVTPGLVNTHHHIYQNLTAQLPARGQRHAVPMAHDAVSALGALDEEAAYVSAWVGLAELALGGCTTTTDHLYVHPRGAGDLISAEIRAAQELGVRFHPTRGSMSLSQKDGGLPPDSVVQDDDEILADSERLVGMHHDRAWGAMVRIALAPCSPFSVTPEPDARDRGAGRAARRAAAHAPRRGSRRGHVRRGDLRAPHDRAVRGGRLGQRPRVGRALHLPERRRGRAAREMGHRCGALPELQHAHRRGWHRAGARVPRARACPSGSAATVPRRPTPRRCGWRRATRCCSAGCARARRRWVRATRWRSRRAGRRGVPRPGGRDRSAVGRARSAISCAGRSKASRSRAH